MMIISQAFAAGAVAAVPSKAREPQEGPISWNP